MAEAGKQRKIASEREREALCVLEIEREREREREREKEIPPQQQTERNKSLRNLLLGQKCCCFGF